MEGGELFNRIQEKKSFTEKGEFLFCINKISNYHFKIQRQQK